VPISQIVGTVEPTRYFDRQFRPTSDHVRERFQRIAVEVRSGRGMDPVELYRCSGSYYVLDGRHRIAVARALGQRSVWALVTEVRLNNPDNEKPRKVGPQSPRELGARVARSVEEAVAGFPAVAGGDGVLDVQRSGPGRLLLDRLGHRPAQHPRAQLGHLHLAQLAHRRPVKRSLIAYDH